MKKILGYVLAFGLITGIIPILVIVLCEKFTFLYGIAGIISLGLLVKELCF